MPSSAYKMTFSTVAELASHLVIRVKPLQATSLYLTVLKWERVTLHN